MGKISMFLSLSEEFKWIYYTKNLKNNFYPEGRKKSEFKKRKVHYDSNTHSAGRYCQKSSVNHTELR